MGEIENGQAAARMLEDEFLQSVFRVLRARYVQQWEGSAEPAIQTSAWHSIKALNDIKHELVRIKDSGTMAERKQAARGR